MTRAEPRTATWMSYLMTTTGDTRNTSSCTVVQAFKGGGTTVVAAAAAVAGTRTPLQQQVERHGQQPHQPLAQLFTAGIAPDLNAVYAMRRQCIRCSCWLST